MTTTGALYGRNSASDEKSIDDQIREGHDDATEAGIKIVAEYSDGKSASRFAKKTRDDWPRVMADIDTRAWDTLILWESSRGSREPVDWFTMLSRCRERDIKIRVITHGRTYDMSNARDWKTLAEEGVSNAYSSEETSLRVKKGVRGAVANGTPLGRETFGYTRTKDRRGKVTGQVPDDNAAVVRAVFALLADGMPGAQVCRTLNDKGYRTSTGKPFTNAHIRDIARRRAYIGERRDPGGDWTPGGWDAIVEESVFWTVQRILDQRAQADAEGKCGREGKVTWLLSGIATCGVCGGPVGGSRSRGMYVGAPCGHVAIVAADLDAYVTAVVVGLLSRPDVYSSLRQAGQKSDAALLAARNEVSRLQAKLEEARAAWTADRLTLESFVDMERRVKPLLKAAQDKVLSSVIPPAVRGLVEPGTDVAGRWQQMPLAARRDVLRALMQVVVNRSQMVDGGWLEVADRVDIKPL